MFQPYSSPDDLAGQIPGSSGIHPAERSLLEKLLSPLDWGRQALTNFGQGLGEIGDGNYGAGLAKMTPGLGGLAAGLLTGGIAAPLVGTGIASLLQGAGNEISPAAMHAMTTKDLLEKFGGDPDSTLQNLAVGAATDPWMYALGGTGMAAGSRRAASIGDRVGGRLGEQIGQRLEQAQIARGPGYKWTPEEADVLMREIGGHRYYGTGRIHDAPGAGQMTAEQFDNLHAQQVAPIVRRFLPEVPVGSKLWQPAGTVPEDSMSLFFKTPEGNVVKVSPTDGLAGRPPNPGILQPHRSAVPGLPSETPLEFMSPRRPYLTAPRPDLVEHMPFIEPLPQTETHAARDVLSNADTAVHGPITQDVAKELLGEWHHAAHPPLPLEDAFNMMLAENPQNHGARQVFADWLEEQGRAGDALIQRAASTAGAQLEAGGGIFHPMMWGYPQAHIWPEPSLFGDVGGVPKLLSPGNYMPFSDATEAWNTATQVNDPNLITRKMLEALGGDQLLQKALAAGHQNTGIPEMMKKMGQMAGSMGGHAAGGLVGASAGALPLILRSKAGY